MELDTGALLSIISEKTYKSLWSSQQQPVLEDTSVRLHTYTKESIRVLGQIAVEVTYKEQVRMLPLLVVAVERPSLFGRNWLAELPVLARVRDIIQKGWTYTNDKDLKPYQRRQNKTKCTCCLCYHRKSCCDA